MVVVRKELPRIVEVELWLCTQAEDKLGTIVRVVGPESYSLAKGTYRNAVDWPYPVAPFVLSVLHGEERHVPCCWLASLDVFWCVFRFEARRGHHTNLGPARHFVGDNEKRPASHIEVLVNGPSGRVLEHFGEFERGFEPLGSKDTLLHNGLAFNRSSV